MHLIERINSQTSVGSAEILLNVFILACLKVSWQDATFWTTGPTARVAEYTWMFGDAQVIRIHCKWGVRI